MFLFGERRNRRKKDCFKVIYLCFLCVPEKDFLNQNTKTHSLFLGTGLGGPITVIQIKVLRFLTVMGYRSGVNILQLFGDKARGLCFGNLVLAKQVAVGQGGGAGRRGWCCKVL